MTARVIRSPEADLDLVEITDFLAGRSPQIAHRFLRALETTLRKLADLPGLGGAFESSNPALAGLRVWPVGGFPIYLIFYRPVDEGVEIVRVVHGARDLENLPPR